MCLFVSVCACCECARVRVRLLDGMRGPAMVVELVPTPAPQCLRARSFAHSATPRSERNYHASVSAYSSDAIMTAYLSDGWSGVVRSTNERRFAGHRVTRKGQFRHEFGLQRVIAKAHPPGGHPEMIMHFPAAASNRQPIQRNCFQCLLICMSLLPTLHKPLHSKLSASTLRMFM